MNETQRAQLRGQHDLGEIIGYAYRLYASNFVALFLIALTTAPLVMLTIVVDRQISDGSLAQNLPSLIQLVGIAVTIVAAASLIYAVHDVSGGTRADAGRSLDAVLERLPPLFATALLFIALLAASIVATPFLAAYWLTHRDATIDGRRDWYLALVPGALTLYLSVRWAFALPAHVIDGGRTWSALDTTADVVRGQWWRTLGTLLVVALVQLGPALLATASMFAAPVVEGVTTSLVNALLLPFGVAAQTLLYYDLKARNSVDLSPARIDAP